jgi:hypothetical protein
MVENCCGDAKSALPKENRQTTLEIIKELKERMDILENQANNISIILKPVDTAKTSVAEKEKPYYVLNDELVSVVGRAYLLSQTLTDIGVLLSDTLGDIKLK